jgi:predicted PurR-regulated permease PerM
MRLPTAIVALIFDARINPHPIKTTAPSNIMKSFKNRISTEMSVLCALALTIPLQAATVVWSTSTAITTSTDVVTTGTTVLAAHAKWNPTANETVNGVTFAATLNNSQSQSFTQSGVTLAFNTFVNINSSNPFIGTKQLTGPAAQFFFCKIF